MKTYRLIKASERQKLQSLLMTRLKNWCQCYSVSPISLRLLPPSPLPENPSLVTAAGMAFMLLEDNYLSFFTPLLFKEDNSSFHSVSTLLVKKLIGDLLDIETCSLEHQFTQPDWSYTGSAALLLELSVERHSLRALISPDWVYAQLSPLQSSKNPLADLEQAVAAFPLQLDLTLRPLKLPLKQLVDLEIGDVISSDHPINTPVLLKHKDRILAEAELGQSNNQKSILLKRFL